MLGSAALWKPIQLAPRGLEYMNWGALITATSAVIIYKQAKKDPPQKTSKQKYNVGANIVIRLLLQTQIDYQYINQKF